MSTFRIIALKVLDDSPKYQSKVLMPCTTYFFFRGYEDVPGTHFIRRTNNLVEELRLYDVFGHDDRRISVEVSAIVGRNGEGKSTVIELLLRLINNFAYVSGFRASQDSLRFIMKMSAAMFYEIDDVIYSIRCDKNGLKWYAEDQEINLNEGEDRDRLVKLRDEHQQKLFYTLVVNYALYSYNSLHFAFESKGDGCWLDGLFHKNDSYQTPLVINPMRTNGNININKEQDLSVQRLMAIFTDAGEEKEQRIVSEGIEAFGFGFSLEKGTKLQDVTLQDYFEAVADDECRMEDLEGEEPVEVAKEMLGNFHEFFSSLDDILEKNNYLVYWLSSYEVDHTPRHSYTDLAGYLDIIARAYDEEKYEHPFDLVQEMHFFMPGRPLRWMNYAQLYRLLLLLTVWDVLREINVVELHESLDEYLKDLENPANKAILYIPYKIIEILSTYEPYKKAAYHYDATCEAMKLDWPNYSIKKALKKDIESILRKDDYTTLKLHQTINYLRERKGSMYNAQPLPWSSEGYKLLIPFVELKKEIYKEKQSLSDMLKRLPPPVFKGEIMLMDAGGNQFPLSSLSSGQQQRLNSGGALVYHLRNLDYRVTDTERIEYDYVTVIMEEVELYFHPEYQRTLIAYFLKQLERARFRHIMGIHLMFVTHSPFILSDVSNRNVLYLSKEDRQPEKESFAANIYDLLDDHFFLDETIGDIALGRINELVDVYQQYVGDGRKDNSEVHCMADRFIQKEKEFRLLKDMLADGYLKDDVSRMYYELAARYLPEKLSDEIERTQQRLDELRALANREQ